MNPTEYVYCHMKNTEKSKTMKYINLIHCHIVDDK